MNPYDPQQVEAVWQRVREGRREETAEEFLSERIREGAAGLKGLARLAKMAGSSRPQLLSMARQQRQQIGSLRTLYDLISGHGAPKAEAPAPTFGSFPEGLRHCFRHSEQEGRSYRQAAERWPEWGRFFTALAQTQEGRSRRLAALLRQSARY